MGRLRDFASIADFFSDREIDELQAAIDARRQARAGRPDDLPVAPTPEPEPRVRASRLLPEGSS